MRYKCVVFVVKIFTHSQVHTRSVYEQDEPQMDLISLDFGGRDEAEKPSTGGGIKSRGSAPFHGT